VAPQGSRAAKRENKHQSSVSEEIDLLDSKSNNITEPEEASGHKRKENRQ